jgi:hypothetical protein
VKRKVSKPSPISLSFSRQNYIIITTKNPFISHYDSHANQDPCSLAFKLQGNGFISTLFSLKSRGPFHPPSNSNLLGFNHTSSAFLARIDYSKSC